LAKAQAMGKKVAYFTVFRGRWSYAAVGKKNAHRIDVRGLAILMLNVDVAVAA
jgi:hypothetical protein